MSKEKIMRDLDLKIKQIKENRLTEAELTNCLDEKNLFILSNSITKILELRLYSPEIIEKLVNLSHYQSSNHSFKTGISIGHFAIAALFIIDNSETNQKYNDLHGDLDSENREKVRNAIIGLEDIVNRNRNSKQDI